MSFPGVRALSDVQLTVRRGEVHAVVGENGAGKSTLMKILAGEHRPDAGTIEIAGREVTLASPRDAQQLGIGMVYQELNLVPDLSAAENIFLGRFPKRFGMVDRRAMRDRAIEILEELDTRIEWWRRVGGLSVSHQQLVEICKIYAAQPRIVVLDEPTSSLSEHETQILFDVVRKMRDRGISIVYVSHRLREVLEIADTVTVLRDGRYVGSRNASGLDSSDMIRMMVGRDLAEVFPKHEVAIGETVLKAEHVSRAGAFRDISLEVKAGEIVALAGLVGSGRTEIARAIFGLDRADAGTVQVRGVPLNLGNLRDAVRAGIAYVPEDRKADGIVPALSARANLSLAMLPRIATAGVVSRGREQRLAQEYMQRLGVSPPTPERRIDTFSGGNQQKVVLGKWLAVNPSVLILDEPTRGVDVGAKADIHHIIGELAESGVAILMISSELPEVLAVADRVYVLHEGAISAEFRRGAATEQSIMRAAAGEEAAA